MLWSDRPCWVPQPIGRHPPTHTHTFLSCAFTYFMKPRNSQVPWALELHFWKSCAFWKSPDLNIKDFCQESVGLESWSEWGRDNTFNTFLPYAARAATLKEQFGEVVVVVEGGNLWTKQPGCSWWICPQQKQIHLYCLTNQFRPIAVLKLTPNKNLTSLRDKMKERGSQRPFGYSVQRP